MSVSQPPGRSSSAQTVRFPKAELPPGTRRVVVIGRREVLVFNVDGTHYAVFNRCPHQQAPLSPGFLDGTTLPTEEVGVYRYGMDGRVLRCPWHKYEFDLATGRCLVEGSRLRVRTYVVREEGEDLVVDAAVRQPTRGE
jgi:nitrite reductase (NADH) small subunit